MQAYGDGYADRKGDDPDEVSRLDHLRPKRTEELLPSDREQRFHFSAASHVTDTGPRLGVWS